jgi:hypothetical protein
MAISLSNVQSTLLPPTLTGPIFDKAVETSAVMSLARRVPLSVNAQTAIPISMDVPAAGWVAEGGAKPVGAASTGVKIMTGKKVALLLPVSQEVVMTNPAGLYDQLEQDLPTAISRAFDSASIRGIDLRTGGAGPFADYLSQTTNTVELGTKTQAAGGMYADLVTGESIVVNNNYDFTGFAADPRLRPTLKLQTDTQGRPLWVDTPTSGLAGSGGTLIGYPAFFNRGVSGAYLRSGNNTQTVTITGAPTGGTFTLSSGGNTTSALAFNAAGSAVQTAIRLFGGVYSAVTVTGAGPYAIVFPTTGAPFTAKGSFTGGTSPAITVSPTTTQDTKLRAVGGDYSQCAYGVGMDISIKVSDTASYVDEASVTHSAFQENLVLLLVEAYYGFVVGNVNAFVTYTDLV